MLQVTAGMLLPGVRKGGVVGTGQGLRTQPGQYVVSTAPSSSCAAGTASFSCFIDKYLGGGVPRLVAQAGW